jgi:hypothetical protein
MKKVSGTILVILVLGFTGCNDSPEADNGKETVATPTAVPDPAGVAFFSEAQTVTLSCTTNGAAVYFTLDGSTPGTASTRYSVPVTIDKTTTLKAVAVKEGMNNSGILTAVYTIGNPDWQTVAKPSANPAGGTYTETKTVTLACATQGATVYYTVNGSTPTASSLLYSEPVSITQTSTLKAVAVKEGMNDSALMTETYTIELPPPLLDETVQLGSLTGRLLVPHTGDAVLTINNYHNVLVNDEDYDNVQYSLMLRSFTTIRSVPNYYKVIDIDGRNVRVELNAKGSQENVDLVYIHHLRQALKNVNAGNVTIVEKTGTFTPVFDGGWMRWSVPESWYINNNESVYKNLFSDYPGTADTVIMEGVTMTTYNGKRVIVYNRPLKVLQLAWQAKFLREESEYYGESNYHGFGLKKGTGGSLLPLRSWENAEILYKNSSSGSGIEIVLHTYETGLKEIDLHPSQGVLINQSDVTVNAIGSADTNIMSNGIYDFILWYYNPAPSGATANDEALAELLPTWTSLRNANLTFDGYAKNDEGEYIMADGKYTPALPEGVTARNIGGTVSASHERKALEADEVYRKDEPREDFIGSVTYAMMRYLIPLHYYGSGNPNNLGITEFRNTNIIGDSPTGDPDIYDAGLRLDITNRTCSNVAFIGNYSRFDTFTIKSQGVIDIKGGLPGKIVGNSTARYLNIWSDVLRKTNISDFPVVVIRGTGGEFITTADQYALNSVARVIIYHNKYTSKPTYHDETWQPKPHYRAFMVGDTPKITGGTVPNVNTAWYQGDQSGSIPRLDETAWIEYANGNISLPSGLASNYANLASVEGGKYQMTQAEWDALP